MVKKLSLKNWPKGYQQKVEDILGTKIAPDGSVQMFFPYETKDEAQKVKKQLTQIQKQLREVKKEAGAEMIQIRNNYTEKKSKVTPGFLASLSGEKAAGKDKEKRRDSLKTRLQKSLEPYETVQDTIDRMLQELDKLKHQVDADMFHG